MCRSRCSANHPHVETRYQVIGLVCFPPPPPPPPPVCFSSFFFFASHNTSSLSLPRLFPAPFCCFEPPLRLPFGLPLPAPVLPPPPTPSPLLRSSSRLCFSPPPPHLSPAFLPPPPPTPHHQSLSLRLVLICFSIPSSSSLPGSVPRIPYPPPPHLAPPSPYSVLIPCLPSPPPVLYFTPTLYPSYLTPLPPPPLCDVLLFGTPPQSFSTSFLFLVLWGQREERVPRAAGRH